MKLHAVQVFGVEPPEQNSCVVFDIPSDSRTILPLPGFPAGSSGTTLRALANPAAACALGSALLPLG
ncbi:MAG: hypothetical protein HY560_12125 [Gemmatimonadetes bacterium]|nr:hypothetical protein [Gemmatimonadota bacterium]